MKVSATIEKSKDGLYSVYSDDHIGNHYFGGYGETEEEALEDFRQSIIDALESDLEIEITKSWL